MNRREFFALLLGTAAIAIFPGLPKVKESRVKIIPMGRSYDTLIIDDPYDDRPVDLDGLRRWYEKPLNFAQKSYAVGFAITCEGIRRDLTLLERARYDRILGRSFAECREVAAHGRT